ncbi:MAG TPA: ribosome rescue protein RqcH [Candidatus Methanoculleus thermohydrogenotrophicum]|jgi:predicted ribosome quality control (RQC) complex YloA/Tae2 family protein|nr:ribosome rescue protein RqcH [Candidatus Methanoculleus thermohydrogenotrophicum]NLM82731.1 fibronectin-binding domain-containing protein [Candidatus Methanoculleus thermohydrogenotrophicum]HOB18294.1 ribosome rescue protein RqcH [Candidatus Methanoculleus thermohydrogenotrophicum]HPZ38415.1 ribosome rescue protein RqcH [Candidatus Methanoculleus thermohydrogenotrophicum]HQC90786.1 ribosome rescue protein RqcH [Candidatus Methanoculleus thermohydrogenotrophicum]
MATLQGMSGVDLRALVSEAADRLPLWVGKIYQFDAKTLGIRLNGEDRTKYLLLVETGRRIHFTAEFPKPPKHPPGFAMLLRKYLNGGKVLSIRQLGIERTMSIDIGKRDTTYHLIFELFDEGNAILCDEDYTIIKPLWHHRFRDRDVVPGAVYAFEGTDCLALPPEEFREMLAGSDRDIVRTLAVGCMLGGAYAEEICLMAGVDKNAAAAEVDAGAVREAYDRLLTDVEMRRHPVITQSGCWPVILAGEEVLQRFETFSEALDAFYPKAAGEKEEATAGKPHLSREETIRRRQAEAIRGFEKKIQRYERIVEILYENYTAVAEIIATLNEASKDRSWQEIERILKTNNDNVAAKMICAVHPAEAAVELDLAGERVKVYVHETIEQNIGRYYDQIKKFKKKKTGALAAMERTIPVKPRRKEHLVLQKKRWYHRFRWFTTSDGVLVIGGRDASQNEELVKKYMEGGDLFLHADVHGGSAVIVKGATEHLDEAAQFAASYSNAWKAGHFAADVYAARPDQVSKTAESGEYVARGAFIVRGERQYFRNVPLGVAIGLQVAPEVAVIGGPPRAIAGRAKAWVTLQPGKYEPNDIARRVIRALREKLPEDAWKGLKNVLNTEAVAAFVPPGGSDIAEP